MSGGDISTVKILLAESVDLNGTDSTGRTPLMFAAGAGRLEVGAEVNDRGCIVIQCDSLRITIYER